MRSIKFIALIISILCIFCSCNDTSSTPSTSTRRAKVRHIWIDNKGIKHYDTEMQIKDVDTLFKANDTALIDDIRYIIVN